MRRHASGFAVAVHLGEESGIAEPARIDIGGRRIFERTAQIREAKLIDDGSTTEKLRECFALGAVGDRHHRPVAPMQHFGVMPGKRVRVSGNEIVERQANLIILCEKRSPAREQCQTDAKTNRCRDRPTGAGS